MHVYLSTFNSRQILILKQIKQMKSQGARHILPPYNLYPRGQHPLAPWESMPMYMYIYIYIYIYKLNYKSHKKDFIKTSTVCFAFTAHQEVILNADEKLRKNARKS